MHVHGFTQTSNTLKKFKKRAEEEHQTRRTVTAEIAGEAPVGSATIYENTKKYI